MKRILLMGMALAVVTLSYAVGSSAGVSWTAPTAYVDGTVLPATDIDHYTVSWTGTSTGSVVVKAGVVTATVPVACGTVNFTVTVTTGAAAHYPNATSGPAGPVAYASGVTCAPNPPGGLAAH
jgi:hypothetical protein